MSLFTDRVQLTIQEGELNTQKALSRFPGPFKWLLIFFILALLPSYFIAKSVSNKIWSNKYSANAIVAKPSFTSPKSPNISTVDVTTLGNNEYAAAVQISNPNLDLSLENVPFTFTFSNAQNQQIYQYNDSLYLLPNQTKYVTVPTFTANDKVAFAGFQLPQNLPWQKRLSITTVNLSSSLPITFQQTTPPAFVVQGDFTNQSPYDLQLVHLTFLLYDVNKNIIGISERDESTVSAFERRTYKQLWPNLNGSNVASVDVFVDTNPLDPNNITAPQTPSGPASDLSRPTIGNNN